MWNKIPVSIKNITPSKGFHKALKTFLLESTSKFTEGYMNNKIEISFARSQIIVLAISILLPILIVSTLIVILGKINIPAPS